MFRTTLQNGDWACKAYGYMIQGFSKKAVKFAKFQRNLSLIINY